MSCGRGIDTLVIIVVISFQNGVRMLIVLSLSLTLMIPLHVARHCVLGRYMYSWSGSIIVAMVAVIGDASYAL